MKAFVDSREPDEVKSKSGYESRELPQADFYLPEHDVAIERKEASDFASSTTDGRLSEQSDRLVAEHDHVYLIIENKLGADYDRNIYSLYNLEYSDIGQNSIIGMQTSLAVKRGVKIIYTEDVEQTLYAVQRIFERFLDEEHKQADEGYVNTADTGEVNDTQVAMLMQVDGISEEKAEAILGLKPEDRQFELFEDFVEYNKFGNELIKSRLTELDGIGEVLAERVLSAFS